MRIALPYGHGEIAAQIPDVRILAVARNGLSQKQPSASADALVAQALENPIGSPPLWELAKATGSTVAAIRCVNKLQDEPGPNQILLIPVS